MLRVILPLLAINLALQSSPVSADASSSWDALVNGKGIFDDLTNLREFKSTTNDNGASQIDQFIDLLEEDDLLENVYSNYRKLFKKTEDTTAAQLNIFKAKLIAAAAHNLEAKEGKHSWVKGVNQFTDMSESELNKRYSVDFSGFVNELKSSNSGSGNLSSLLTKENPFPDALNWTEKGIVTSVKHQGDCNTCALFSSTAQLESLTALGHGREPVDLSPQELLDCAVPYFQCSDPGTRPSDSVKYLMTNGTSTWEDYPYNYPQFKGACKAGETTRAAQFLDGAAHTEPNEEDMKNAVAEFGPMMTGLKSEFEYDGGILENPACGGTPNHAVLIVGYGSEGGKDYWIVKNSYGEFWGESGYMRIRRNDNRACGIGCFVFVGTSVA